MGGKRGWERKGQCCVVTVGVLLDELLWCGGGTAGGTMLVAAITATSTQAPNNTLRRPRCFTTPMPLSIAG